jgi:hypothetical protein
MNPQIGLFYPPLWLFPALRIPYTLKAAVVLQCLHVLAGAVGMYVLLRIRLRSRREALIGAFVYQFFGGFYSNAEHVDIIRAFAISPWLLAAATVRLSDPPIPTRLLLLPAAVFLMATGAYPGNIVAALLMCGLYLVLQALDQLIAGIPKRRVALRIASGALLLVIGIGMAIPSLGPPLLFRKEVVRYHLGPTSFATFSWIHLAGLFLPNDRLPGDISMSSTFIGFVVLAGVVLLRRRVIRLISVPAALALFAAAMAAGPPSPIYRAVRAALPILGSSRFPLSDYRAWFAIGLISCAATSLRDMRIRPMTVRRFLFRVAILGGLVIWGTTAAYGRHPAGAVAISAAIALAAALAGIHLWQRRSSSGWRMGIAGLLFIIGADSGRVILAVEKTWAVPDLLRYWQNYYGGPVRLQETGRVVSPLVFAGTTRRPPRVDPGPGNYRASGYLIGTYNTRDFGNLLLESKRRVDEVPWMHAFIRRAWAPLLYPIPRNAERDLSWLPVAAPGSAAWVAAPGSVVQTHYGLDRIDYRASLPAPALLVENETFFPGWCARVGDDGRLIQAVRVNGGLRGWLLPAGRYEIHAQFSFPHFPTMLRVGGAALVVYTLIYAVTICARRSRRLH